MKKPVAQSSTKIAGTKPRQAGGAEAVGASGIGGRLIIGGPLSGARLHAPLDLGAWALYMIAPAMRRRSLTLALIGLAALAILYTIYWIILGRILDENIAGWAALRRAEGYAVSYEATSIGGYPFTLTT